MSLLHQVAPSPPAAHRTMAACELSVVIKALNEERNIERTLACALAAVAGRDAEVILADSLSTDRTVALASAYPVKVVQLEEPGDRGCGVGAQLGYQFARGQYLLVIDGDMDLQKDFVDAALLRLQAEAGLAGVGGNIVDVNFNNIEYRARQARAPLDAKAGLVDRLNGGGLFRREAIESIGYLTHRGLHACEELEQALRLASRGWRMERLALVSVYHHGHTAATWTLMRRRWASRYVCGGGELVRASLGRPHQWQALRSQRHLFVVLGWWAVLLLLLQGAATAPQAGPWLASWAVLLVLPVGLRSWRRRSLAVGAYSVASWCLDAAGFLRGLVCRLPDPGAAIAARVVHDGRGR